MGNDSPTQYSNSPLGTSYDPSQWQVKQKLSNYQVLHNIKLDLNADCYEIALNQADKNLLRYEARRPGNRDTRDLVWVYHIAFQQNGFLCSDGQTVRVLTQHIPIRLDSVRNLEESEALGVLKGALLGFSVLNQEYDNLRLTERCIGFNESGKVKVWLNQNFALNNPSIEPFLNNNSNCQLLNSTEKLKYNVSLILKIITNRTLNLNPHLKRTFEQKQLTYEEAIDLIDQYAEMQRVRISPVIRHKHFIDSHFHSQAKEYPHKDKQKQGSFANPTQKWVPINTFNNTNNTNNASNGIFVNRFNYGIQQNYQSNHNEAIRRMGSVGSLHSNATIYRNQVYSGKDLQSSLGMAGSIKLNSPGQIYRQPISTHQLSQRSLTTNSWDAWPMMSQMNSQRQNRQNQRKEYQEETPIQKIDLYWQKNTVRPLVVNKFEQYNFGNSLDNFRADQSIKPTVIIKNLQPQRNHNQQKNQFSFPSKHVTKIQVGKDSNNQRGQRKVEKQSHDNRIKMNEFQQIKGSEQFQIRSDDPSVPTSNFNPPIVSKTGNSSHRGTLTPQNQYELNRNISGEEDGTEQWKQYQRRKQQKWQSSNKPNQQIQTQFRSIQSSLHTPKTPQRINSENTTEEIEKYIRKKYLQGGCDRPQEYKQRLQKRHNQVAKQGNIVVNIKKNEISNNIEDAQMGRHDLMTFMPQDKQELNLQMIKDNLDKKFSDKIVYQQQKNNTDYQHKAQKDILDIANLDKKLTQFSSSRVKNTEDCLNSDTKTQLKKQEPYKINHLTSLENKSANSYSKQVQVFSQYQQKQTKKYSNKYISNIDQKYQKYIASKQRQKDLFNQTKKKQINKEEQIRGNHFRERRLKTIQPDSKQQTTKPIHKKKQKDYPKEVKGSPTYQDMRKLLWE